MKQILLLTASILLSGLMASQGFAETSGEDNSQKIQNLEQQMSQMQDELKSIKGEPTVKHTRYVHKNVSASTSSGSHPSGARKHAIKTVGDVGLVSTTATTSTSQPSTASMSADTRTTTQSTAPTFTNAYIGNPQSFPIDLNVPGRSFVSTGPYIGVPLVYSGGNLIINSPSVNEDVVLLNMRKAIRTRLDALGRPHDTDHAHLLLSGIVEAQASYQDPGVGPTGSDIDLSTMELDGYLLGPSDWVSGLFAFAYDDVNGTDEGSLNNASRVQNSRLFLNKAFITIGNFSVSPIYASIGQFYVPFGTYSTNMVSSPLTKILGRTKARALVIGMQERGDDALYLSGYMFRGDSHAGSTNRLDNGGFNMGYRFVAGKISGDFGGGAIMNIADSQGMQNNFNPSNEWGGFGASPNGSEVIQHRVPAMDFRGLLSIGDKWDLLGEFISAINAFSPQDLTYNSHGAKPEALNVEGTYTFQAFDRPTSIALAYGKSWNALALNLALQRFSVALNTSWWKDTLQSLEVRHDQNYAASSYVIGNTQNTTVPIQGMGKPDNIVTAQFDIYF